MVSLGSAKRQKDMLSTVLLLASTTKIVPGISIGQAKIGESIDAVLKRFGPSDPELSDAAMGHYWSAWKKGEKILAIYSSRTPEDSITTRIIHVNSPAFKLSNGIHVGSSWSTIHRAFPQLKRVIEGNKGVAVWDDVKRGIGFDIAKGKCVGVAVHQRGEALGSEYLNYSVNAISKPPKN